MIWALASRPTIIKFGDVTRRILAMSQHFLLSAAARTLSMSAVARMSDQEAHAKFVEIRWADNEGQPYCPECGCAKVYAFATLKLWKCSACRISLR